MNTDTQRVGWTRSRSGCRIDMASKLRFPYCNESRGSQRCTVYAIVLDTRTPFRQSEPFKATVGFSYLKQQNIGLLCFLWKHCKSLDHVQLSFNTFPSHSLHFPPLSPCFCLEFGQHPPLSAVLCNNNDVSCPHNHSSHQMKTPDLFSFSESQVEAREPYPTRCSRYELQPFL